MSGRAVVRLLDGFSLDVESHPPAFPGALPRAAQRLVALLCLSGRADRTAVAGRLWPDVPERCAHGSLRSALWRLQKAAPGVVEAANGVLALTPGVRVDVHELVDWAQRALDPRAEAHELTVPSVGFSGDLLPGWYDDWVLLDRERLRQLRVHALEVVAGRLAAADRPGEALQAAYAAVRSDPLRESAYRTIVQVHLREGNAAEAIRVHDTFRTMLRSELGLEPSPQMTGLVRCLLRS